MKINIDLIKTFPNFYFMIIFCLIRGYIFLNPWKSHGLDGKSDSTPRILTLKNLEALSEIFLPLSLCSSRTSSTSGLSSTIFTSSNTVVTLSIEVCWSFSLGSTVLLEVGEFISLSNSTSDSSKAESSAALSYSWSLWKIRKI